MRPPTASAMCLDACFQRTLGVAPLPLAPTRPHMAIRATRDSNFGSGNHDMPGLSAFAYTSGSPIRALPTHLSACSQRILGVVPCALRSQTRHNNTITSPKLALSWATDHLPAAPGSCRCRWVAYIRMAGAPPSRPLLLTGLGCDNLALAPRSDSRGYMDSLAVPGV
jgi:hypothetical protein